VSVNTKSRLTLAWLGYFALVLLPTFLVLGLFLFDRMLNQFVLAGTLVLAVFGAFMAVRTVDAMRGLRDDERTRQWLEAAERRDRAKSAADDRDLQKEKLLEELRGGRNLRLSAESKTPAYWRHLAPEALQSQIVRLLKKLGRRVQRSGDSAYRGFDLVIDNNAIVKCGTDSKKEAKLAAEQLLRTMRANPTCKAAILVWPRGFSAPTRYLARGTDLILWDADNIARLVRERKLG
jgi:hypothetical protein